MRGRPGLWPETEEETSTYVTKKVMWTHSSHLQPWEKKCTELYCRYYNINAIKGHLSALKETVPLNWTPVMWKPCINQLCVNYLCFFINAFCFSLEQSKRIWSMEPRPLLPAHSQSRRLTGAWAARELRASTMASTTKVRVKILERCEKSDLLLSDSYTFVYMVKVHLPVKLFFPYSALGVGDILDND